MKTIISISLLSLFLTSLSAQRPGDLYTDFGNSGVFLANWEDTVTQIFDLAMTSDGEIMISGSVRTDDVTLSNAYVLKLDDMGNLVPFGNCSIGFVYDFGCKEYAKGITALPDDGMLVAGRYAAYENDSVFPFLLKLLPDGQIDAEFGEDGLYTNREAFEMIVMDMEIYQQEDSYSIILAGHNNDEIKLPLMIMISDEGAFMSSFGIDGFLELPDHRNGMFTDIAIDDENNNLYAGGFIFEGGSFLAKFDLPDGSPDSDFGEDGTLNFTPDDGFEGEVNTIVFDKEDNTLAAFGYYPHPAGDNDIFAYRLNASDSIADNTFGSAGFSTLRVAGSDELIISAILQSDGKYYFGGYSDYNGTDDFFLGRLNHNGIGDTAFGTNGLVLNALEYTQKINCLALSPEEDILYAAGYSDDGSGSRILVAAYYTGKETEPGLDFKENRNSACNLFPNPALGRITIQSRLMGQHRVQVFDFAGKILVDQKYNNNCFDVNLGSLQPSVYLIRVTLPDGQAIISKLVKH